MERPPIEPIRTSQELSFLNDQQLDNLQEATLRVLETTGVQFPSQKALAIFAGHGAEVDDDSQIVKIPRELVFKAMSTIPRYFTLGARDPESEIARNCRHCLKNSRKVYLSLPMMAVVTM